jgi:hypothetical protein
LPTERRNERSLAFLELHQALQKVWTKEKQNKPALLTITPTAKKLMESKLSVRSLISNGKQVDIRSALLQKYCAELCASEELARYETVTSFFWPSGARGSGQVIAPDGSTTLH